jgi:hypothetical protein
MPDGLPVFGFTPAIKIVGRTIGKIFNRLYRRVFVDTPKGRRSAAFTVPESAEAADVSMALRRRGWSPYALRLDPEQHAWIALVMDWQHAA